jgi:hypothetical protein
MDVRPCAGCGGYFLVHCVDITTFGDPATRYADGRAEPCLRCHGAVEASPAPVMAPAPLGPHLPTHAEWLKAWMPDAVVDL